MVALDTVAASEALERRIWDVLESVSDPEIPVLSIVDLGIVRSVSCDTGGCAITITPTYSGCPAMEMIRAGISEAIAGVGLSCRIETTLTPAWTTDWMSDRGRERLRTYGIAPPLVRVVDISGLRSARREPAVACPHCGSHATRVLSQFGSTACKALYRCDDCLEPFDYFKNH